MYLKHVEMIMELGPELEMHKGPMRLTVARREGTPFGGGGV